MKKVYKDPNIEVEKWKDKCYRKLINSGQKDIARKAKEIIRKYGLKVKYYQPEFTEKN